MFTIDNILSSQMSTISSRLGSSQLPAPPSQVTAASQASSLPSIITHSNSEVSCTPVHLVGNYAQSLPASNDSLLVNAKVRNNTSAHMGAAKTTFSPTLAVTENCEKCFTSGGSPGSCVHTPVISNEIQNSDENVVLHAHTEADDIRRTPSTVTGPQVQVSCKTTQSTTKTRSQDISVNIPEYFKPWTAATGSSHTSRSLAVGGLPNTSINPAVSSYSSPALAPTPKVSALPLISSHNTETFRPTSSFSSMHFHESNRCGQVSSLPPLSLPIFHPTRIEAYVSDHIATPVKNAALFPPPFAFSMEPSPSVSSNRSSSNWPPQNTVFNPSAIRAEGSIQFLNPALLEQYYQRYVPDQLRGQSPTNDKCFPISHPSPLSVCHYRAPVHPRGDLVKGEIPVRGGGGYNMLEVTGDGRVPMEEFVKETSALPRGFLRVPFPFSMPGNIAHTKRRRRGIQVRFSAQQSQGLEQWFSSTRFITPQQRRTIANQLHLHEKQVMTWFQNRRAKTKKVKLQDSKLSMADIHEESLSATVGSSR